MQARVGVAGMKDLAGAGIHDDRGIGRGRKTNGRRKGDEHPQHDEKPGTGFLPKTPQHVVASYCLVAPTSWWRLIMGRP